MKVKVNYNKNLIRPNHEKETKISNKNRLYKNEN